MNEEFISNTEIAHTIFNSANEGILIADIESLKFCYANQSICDMFRYSHEEFPQLSVPDIHPPEPLQSVLETFQKQSRGEIQIAQNIPCMRKDGTVFQADINASKITISNRQYVVGYFTDVTERYSTRQKLDEALKGWKTIFEAIPHPTILMDETHTITAVNTKILKLSRKDPLEIIGRKCWEIFHGTETETPPSKCPFEKMLSSGNIERTDMEMKAFGGWYIVSCTPILDASGNLKNIIHIAIDITDRKRMERELEASAKEHRDISATLETILDSIPDVIGVQNLEHGIIRYNKAGYDFLQKRPEDIDGQKCFELIGRTAPCEECATAKVYQNKKPVKFERFFNEIDRWIDIRAYPVFDSDGNLAKIIEHLRDISDQKKMESERIQNEKRQQQSQKLESVGVLAGGIAHDFNNLLGGIYGFLDLARTKSTDPEAISCLDSSISSIERARGLTQQLLIFSKGGSPNRKTASLNGFIRETTEFSLSGSTVLVSFSIPDNLWVCDYDDNQIDQVINNIVINAVQAMPMGGTLTVSAENIVLKADEHPVLPPGRYVGISFRDSGIGMPDEIVNRAFDPFFTTKQKGSGLGLATSYSIVKKHDGYIHAVSEPGKGSTVQVFLPASEKEVPRKKEKPKAISPTTAGLIIVMDDEDMLRNTISKMLQHGGNSVLLAKDGQEAIRLFDECRSRNEAVAALILDLTVPGGMGGEQTVGEIRKRDPKIPVFVASGYSANPIIQNPTDYGFTDSIQKPFLAADLNELLSKHIK